MYKSKYEKVDILPIRIVKSNVSSVGPSSERKEYSRQACMCLPLESPKCVTRSVQVSAM